MGIAIRTGSPLSLTLAEPVWKQLAGSVLSPPDITEVDRDYVPGGVVNGIFGNGKVVLFTNILYSDMLVREI